jgi:hypothetical protein
MNVAIIGSRSFVNYVLLIFKLLPYKASIKKIISGGAPGADGLADIYSKEFDIPIKIFEAEWDDINAEPCKIKHNKQGKPYNAIAGFNRNTKIIENSDFVIAFWDGKSNGTRDSIKKAHQMRKDILIIYV